MPTASSARILPAPPAGLELRDDLVAELERLYATPPRHYHTLEHVAEVGRHWSEVHAEGGWGNPAETWVAVLYHDAIYEAGRPDNESRSAEVAADGARRHWPEAGLDSEYIVRLVELTARHGKLDVSDVSDEEALFLDCDLAVLGAPAEVYDAYRRGVESEYLAVFPEALYRAGRQTFLQRLLASERVFLSDRFHDRCDGAARRNVERELAGQ